MTSEPEGFEAIKNRVNEIADEVAKDGISLDEALALYEEAVKLGLQACDVSEEDILDDEPEDDSGVTEAAADENAAEASDVPVEEPLDTATI